MRLLDANVLLPLLRKDHAFHRPLKRWFTSLDDPAWATSTLTEAAFIRLSSNEAVLPPPERPLVAFEALRASKLGGLHRFLEFRSGPEHDTLMAEILGRCTGHHQVPDAFLLHLAITHRVRLTTFDSRLRQLSPDPTVVELLRLSSDEQQIEPDTP